MKDTIFDIENFKNEGHKLIDFISKELEISKNSENQKTIKYNSPNNELEFWQNDFNSNNNESISDFLKKVFSRSINFHSKGYVGHQVAVTAPITALTSALCAYMNNSTTVYELAMPGNAMEKVVINHLCEKYGYESGSTGIVTSGGSLGNLTALVNARNSYSLDENENDKLAIMVSKEAHYSVERACKIMGIRTENIIKIPANSDFSVKTELIEPLYKEATSKGLKVFCVVGCACTTSVGVFDNLDEIAAFTQKYNIWFHVDGAHGGAVIFSDKYKHLIKGIEKSDSLIVDFHKMMLVPPLSTAVLYNSKNKRLNEFSPKKALYLWQNQLSEDWYNSAKHTLECTKPVSILNTYILMKMYKDKIYEWNVDNLFSLGEKFAQMIKDEQNMELAVEPKSNIVCFRYIKNNVDLDKLNKEISEKLLEDGTFYVVSTMINNKFYHRITFMNPMTDENVLKAIIVKMKEFANEN